MNIKMDLSEILLYLDILRRENKSPELPELNLMLYFLDNYAQVKVFTNKLLERPNITRRFITGSLRRFIEDYDDWIKIRNYVLDNAGRNYEMLFKHQIRLSKSKEQALSIIKEARERGYIISEEWANNYDTKWFINEEQKKWRNDKKNEVYDSFPIFYGEFSKMKTKYFKSLSLQQIKEILIYPVTNVEASQNIIQSSIFSRSVYIKEYARRVANGICQLCDNKAPFFDKHGVPFLEVHHIHYLSKGGSDTIDNVVALCPNCHRRIHQLELEGDTNKITEKALANMKIDLL